MVVEATPIKADKETSVDVETFDCESFAKHFIMNALLSRVIISFTSAYRHAQKLSQYTISHLYMYTYTLYIIHLACIHTYIYIDIR